MDIVDMDIVEARTTSSLGLLCVPSYARTDLGRSREANKQTAMESELALSCKTRLETILGRGEVLLRPSHKNTRAGLG
jgi:hypothetical protein